MKQITVRLPDDQYGTLEQISEQQGIPLAVIVRNMVMQSLADNARRSRERKEQERIQQQFKGAFSPPHSFT